MKVAFCLVCAMDEGQPNGAVLALVSRVHLARARRLTMAAVGEVAKKKYEDTRSREITLVFILPFITVEMG